MTRKILTMWALIGNEANGLTEETIAGRLPGEDSHGGKVESLNAAIAASVLMFETARQRRSCSVPVGEQHK